MFDQTKEITKITFLKDTLPNRSCFLSESLLRRRYNCPIPRFGSLKPENQWPTIRLAEPVVACQEQVLGRVALLGNERSVHAKFLTDKSLPGYAKKQQLIAIKKYYVILTNITKSHE
jgi:hypothetical protein